jgi:hypothetical protein
MGGTGNAQTVSWVERGPLGPPLQILLLFQLITLLPQLLLIPLLLQFY